MAGAAPGTLSLYQQQRKAADDDNDDNDDNDNNDDNDDDNDDEPWVACLPGEGRGAVAL